MENAIALLTTGVDSMNSSAATTGGQPDLLTQTALLELKTKVDAMDNQVTDQTYSLILHSFGSEYQVQQFVEEEEVTSSGQFWDLFSVIVHMGPKNLSSKDRADASFSATRVKMTGRENDLLSAMFHAKPACLYEVSDGVLTAVEGGFGAIPSYAKWVGNQLESTKDTLTTQVQNYVESLKGTLALSGKGPELARAMLSEVKDQWSAFALFVDTFHQELVETCGFTTKKAFLLIGRYSHVIWASTTMFRARVCLLEEVATLKSKSSVIWAVMQCHRVMKSFVDVKFRGHPTIIKEITLFMLKEQADPAELILLEIKVTEATQAAQNSK